MLKRFHNNQNWWTIIVVVFIASICVFFNYSQSLAMSNTLHYQARLMNKSGNIVSNGYYTVSFSLYTQSSGGSSFWSETHTLYATRGYVDAQLGSITPLNTDFSGSDYYLGVRIGSDSEMTPRKQLGSAPWSLNASNSQALQGATPGTGSNNILKLNSLGEIDIAAGIKSAGTLEASNGLNITGGSVSLPANSITYSSLNLANQIQGSDLASNISINTSGDITTSGTMNITGAFELNSVTVLATAGEINVLGGYTGNTNDLNILSGGALAGVTSTNFQYLVGTTSNLQTQLNSKLNLSGGTMSGAINMGGNNITGTGDISFNAVTNTIAGIQNQNLLDLSANETITGGWSFNNNITVADGQWVGLGATDARILFTEVGATDSITVQNANLIVDNIYPSNVTAGTLRLGNSIDATSVLDLRFNRVTMLNVEASNNDTIFTINQAGVNVENTTGITVENNAFTNDENYVAKFIGNSSIGQIFGIKTRGGVVGGGTWTGQSTGAWTIDGVEAYIDITLDGNARLAVNDLVYITPASQPQGIYWVDSVNAGIPPGFRIRSNNNGENMQFNWMIIRLP